MPLLAVGYRRDFAQAYWSLPFCSERGLPILLGRRPQLRHLSVCLGRYGGIFMRCIFGMSGQADLGTVAGPVSDERRHHDSLGIAVAIPAVVFYNLAVHVSIAVWCITPNDRAWLIGTFCRNGRYPAAVNGQQIGCYPDRLAKGMHSNTADAQQVTHYHSSAASQP